MAPIRAFGAALGAAVAAGLLASAAPAAVVRPPSDHTLTTTHFAVHYFTCVEPTTDAPCGPPTDYATQTEAGDVAAYAEDAYARFVSWGLTPPVDDGDGHIDIYLEDLPGRTGFPSLEAYSVPDNAGPAPSSGMFYMTSPEMMTVDFAKLANLSLAQEEQKAIANELFTLFEFATWVPTDSSDYWLIDGAAQWAAFQEMGYAGGGTMTTLASPDISIDCRDSLATEPDLGFRMCDPDRWTELGYTRWAFFQLLANKYGNSFITSALANGEAGQTATTALSNAIAAKGSSLSSVYNEYATDLMSGNFGVPALATVRPTPYASVTTGTLSSPTSLPIEVPVNHLSSRYVTFQRGDGDGSHACYAAKLTINVTIPSGTSSQPYFFWDATGSTPQALNVNGSSASITVPWDTCDWGTSRGWLSLPNASTTTDAAAFSVTSSLSVDTSTPASPTSAPTPVPIWGTTVPVPATDVAPSIDVFGPELLKLDATSPTIRLIVESSGPGTVNAALGTVALGSGSLRAGNNDLRFSVPKAMLASLRRSASAANVLTLTPLSPSGAAAGTAVTRQVVIAPAKVKATTKAKAKVKAKAKAHSKKK